MKTLGPRISALALQVAFLALVSVTHVLSAEHYLLLGIVSPRENGRAVFLTSYKEGVFNDEWNDDVRRSIIETQEFTIFHKGRPVGIFYADSLLESEDMNPQVAGRTRFREGPPMPLVDFYTLRKFFYPAISAGRSVDSLCSQPDGYHRHRFVMDFDCDNRADTLQVQFSDSAAKIVLILANERMHLIDTIERPVGTGRDTLTVDIEDILDIDKDHVPEFILIEYTPWCWSAVVYDLSSGTWERLFAGRKWCH